MKKFVALLIAAVFLVAVQPGAMAMPATSTHSVMQVTNCCSQEMANCDRNMPVQKHGTPCKGAANCPGMLKCSAAAAVVPAIGTVIPPIVVTGSPLWHLQESGSSLAPQPDNPPPIA